jgi:hypothetical protein
LLYSAKLGKRGENYTADILPIGVLPILTVNISS